MDIVRFFYRFSHRKASLSGRVGKRVVLEGQSKQKMKNTISIKICVFAVGFSFYLDPNISDKKITLQMIYCKQSTLDLRFKRLCPSHWHDVPTFPAEQLPSTLPTFSHLADFSASCYNLMSIFYFPRPSQKTNFLVLFYFNSQISITCFGLRPGHMVSDVLLTKINGNTKRLAYKIHFCGNFTFTFCQKGQAKSSQN